MKRKDIRAIEQRENFNGVCHEEDRQTTILRDGTRTQKAKVQSREIAQKKRRLQLKEKIENEKDHIEHEKHIYGLADSQMKRLEKMTRARERA